VQTTDVVAPAEKEDVALQAEFAAHRIETRALGSVTGDDQHRQCVRGHAATKLREGTQHHVVALHQFEASDATDYRTSRGDSEFAPELTVILRGSDPREVHAIGNDAQLRSRYGDPLHQMLTDRCGHRNDDVRVACS